MARGIFVAIEGMDGTGKSTQVNSLVARLSELGAATIKVTDPGTGLSGQAIRKVLLDKQVPLDPEQQLLLYTAARRASVALIEQSLANGVNVVSDRWVLSTFVYQGRVIADGMEAVEELHKRFIAIDPDVYIVLDAPCKVAMLRCDPLTSKQDRFESQALDWWESLRSAYITTANELGLSLVDASGNPDDVQAKIRRICQEAHGWPQQLAGV